MESMKRMLIDQDDMEQKIKDLKKQQMKQFPEFEKILAEPYYKKKGLVRSHNEIIKFPVGRTFKCVDLFCFFADKEVFCIHFKRLVNSPGGLIKSNKSIDFGEKMDLFPLVG